MRQNERIPDDVVTLSGKIRVSWEEHSKDGQAAEIVFRGDFSFQGRTFQRLPFFRLTIQTVNDRENVNVHEWYTPLLPQDLRFAREFRRLLLAELQSLSKWELADYMKAGVERYHNEISSDSGEDGQFVYQKPMADCHELVR